MLVSLPDLPFNPVFQFSWKILPDMQHSHEDVRIPLYVFPLNYPSCHCFESSMLAVIFFTVLLDPNHSLEGRNIPISEKHL